MGQSTHTSKVSSILIAINPNFKAHCTLLMANNEDEAKAHADYDWDAMEDDGVEEPEEDEG